MTENAPQEVGLDAFASAFARNMLVMHRALAGLRLPVGSSGDVFAQISGRADSVPAFTPETIREILGGVAPVVAQETLEYFRKLPAKE